MTLAVKRIDRLVLIFLIGDSILLGDIRKRKPLYWFRMSTIPKFPWSIKWDV
jgi:hypothetical protein